MSKSQTTYVVMILVFSLGLWAIMRAGSHLRAAPDIAGDWVITWDAPQQKSPDRLTFAQSGRFIVATLNTSDGDSTKLRGTLERTGTGATIHLTRSNPQTELSATLDPSDHSLIGIFDNSTGWHAIRASKPSSR